MAYEIAKGDTNFLMGISDPEQLISWISATPLIRGACFLGRSNVGKSTLINSLFGKSTARTSKTPGRTREINLFSFQLRNNVNKQLSSSTFYLFDVPGYGHAEVSKQLSKNWNILMDTFFQMISSTVSMINLQDARHPNQSADKEFQNFLNNYDFETILVFNKIDKLKNQKERSVLEKLKPTIYKQYKHVNSIHFVSAEKKIGIDILHDSIVSSLLIHEQTIF